MADIHKKMTTEDVKKMQWCAKIALYLEQHSWTFHEGYELGENLYYDYVECGDPECDPIETLKEEMTYWGD